MPAIGRLSTIVGEEKQRSSSLEVSLLSRLRAMILLGGSLRPSELLLTTGRAVVDLPVDRGLSMLGLWQRHLDELARKLSIDTLSLRVALDRRTPEPAVPEASDRVELSIERDEKDFRGTGGLIRDLTRDYDPDDYVLVANAAQVMSRPLVELVETLAATEADVAVATCGMGSPSGLSLVRCGALDALPDIGFVDLKEQGLIQIAQAHDVRVVEHPRMPCVTVRDLTDYIRALRAYHRGRTEKGSLRTGAATAGSAEAVFDDEGFASFSLVEEGAEVELGALLHDSVVLRDAKVARGATVIRGLVTGHSAVSAGKTIFERVVCDRRRLADVAWADGSHASSGTMQRLAGMKTRTFSRLRLW